MECDNHRTNGFGKRLLLQDLLTAKSVYITIIVPRKLTCVSIQNHEYTLNTIRWAAAAAGRLLHVILFYLKRLGMSFEYYTDHLSLSAAVLILVGQKVST